MLIQSGDTPTDLTFIEHSIPPIHVLVRAMDLRYNRVDIIWALPYFIQTNTQIIGACGFKDAPKNSRIEIGYNVAPDAQGLGVTKKYLTAFTIRHLYDSGFLLQTKMTPL